MTGLKNFRESVIAGLMGFLLAVFASTGAVALFARGFSLGTVAIVFVLPSLSAFVCVWWTYFIPEGRPWYVRGWLAGIRGGLVMAAISAVLAVASTFLLAE